MRWTLRDAPTARDPLRRQLLLKASPGEIQSILRRLGPLCSRPKKEQGEYSHSLYLHGIDAASLPGVEAEIRASEGGSVATKTPPPKASAAPAAPVEPLPLAASVAPDPAMTFETLVVGPFNRFTHAAAIAVAASPGYIYNPLFLSGPPGCGKTHMLQAVAAELRPKGPVWQSSGYRLSCAASDAAHGGRAGELEALARDAKALVIDDFHLMEVNDENRELLLGIFRSFLGSSKQIILSSAYAPKWLAALEKSLDFRFSAGWAGDIKAAGGAELARILLRLLVSGGFEASLVDAEALRDRMAGDPAELSRLSRRIASLGVLGPAKPSSLGEVLEKLLPPPSAPKASGADPAPFRGAGRFALVSPSGQEERAKQALSSVASECRASGWEPPLAPPAILSYDPMQMQGVPFALAAECRRLGMSAALVLGPTPGSDLANREGELRYAMEHLFLDIRAALAWLPCSQWSAAAAWQAALDLRGGLA